MISDDLKKIIDRYSTPFTVGLYGIGDNKAFVNFVNKVLSLPPSLSLIMKDFSTAEFIEEKLGPNFNLNLEQKTEITRIIRDVLLGDLSTNDAPIMVSQRLNVDSQIAQQIWDKIIKELLAPAIEDIKKIQREKFPERVGQGSAKTMPQPPAPPQIKNTPPVNQSNIIDLRQNSNS